MSGLRALVPELAGRPRPLLERLAGSATSARRSGPTATTTSAR